MDRPQRGRRVRRDHHRAQRPDGRGRHPGPGARPRRAAGNGPGARDPAGRPRRRAPRLGPSPASTASSASSRTTAWPPSPPRSTRRTGGSSGRRRPPASTGGSSPWPTGPASSPSLRGKRAQHPPRARDRAGRGPAPPVPGRGPARSSRSARPASRSPAAAGRPTSSRSSSRRAKATMAAHVFSLGTQLAPGSILPGDALGLTRPARGPAILRGGSCGDRRAGRPARLRSGRGGRRPCPSGRCSR